MTETEWLTCTDPRVMIDHLKDSLSPRKFRLLLAAVARLGWDDLKDDACQEAILAAEEHGDGLISDDQLTAAGYRAAQARQSSWSTHIFFARGFAQWATADDPVDAAWEIARHAVQVGEPDRVTLLKLIREIAGNPFCPVAIDPDWLIANFNAVSHIAWGIYEERAFDQLSVLADALLDAGCEDRQLLKHFRSRGSHVRGCWALDLLLGRG